MQKVCKRTRSKCILRVYREAKDTRELLRRLRAVAARVRFISPNPGVSDLALFYVRRLLKIHHARHSRRRRRDSFVEWNEEVTEGRRAQELSRKLQTAVAIATKPRRCSTPFVLPSSANKLCHRVHPKKRHATVILSLYLVRRVPPPRHTTRITPAASVDSRRWKVEALDVISSWILHSSSSYLHSIILGYSVVVQRRDSISTKERRMLHADEKMQWIFQYPMHTICIFHYTVAADGTSFTANAREWYYAYKHSLS